MMTHIQHRGPDGEGLWISPDGRAVLGHRRLSIIDLEGGAQPMTGTDPRCAITFNGEIYNYRELATELAQRGVNLRTRSDTEVLLRRYELDGEACLADCAGMFAFALWDGRQSRFLLARDRLGKKPLYFAQERGILYFASTLASVRSALSNKLNVDLCAVDDFLELGYIPAPRTIFQGVAKLPAGTVLTLQDAELRSARFWSASSSASPEPDDRTDNESDLAALLESAVSIRLRSDVPLGIFLSGGIDSSLVTAVAAREVAGIKTFAIAFGEEGFDEAVFAERVSRSLGTEHRTIHVREELIEILPGLVRHAGEPFADASALPLWVLAREARGEVTVALGGDGGDEGFAGYPWYRLHPYLERRRALLPGRLSHFAARALSTVGGGGSRVSAAAARARRGLDILSEPTPGLRFAALRVHVNDGDARSWYGEPLREARAGHQAAPSCIASAYSAADGDSLRRMRVADIETWLADGLMPKADVATMAHALELRSPLLDHRVVSFGLSLSKASLEDDLGGKRPLRRLLERFIPAELVRRPKQGFVVPLSRWFRHGLRRRVDGLPNSDAINATGWFDTRGIGRLVEEHASERRDHSQRLFNLVVLEEWLRQE